MILLSQWPRIRENWLRRSRDQLPASGAGRQLISGDDALTTLLLLHLGTIAATKKPPAWPSEALRVSRDLHAHLANQLAAFTTQIPAGLVELTGRQVADLSIDLFAAYVLEKIEVTGLAIGRYQPSGLRLEGASRLQEALKEGRGAVLWCDHSFSASLLLKAALASNGFQVHHLSRPSHNLSSTRFGLRFLNPIVRKAEDRYLAERILLEEGDELAVSRRILQLLRHNEIVSVTVFQAGSQVVEAPVLNGVVRVATGAPHFALRSGAPLLPVFSFRDADEFVVEIGEAIELTGASRDAAYQCAVSELARRLGDYVQKHPLDWCDWFGGTYFEPARDPHVEGVNH